MFSFPLHQHTKEDALLSSYLYWEPLLDILTGETGVSSAGYPYICDASFQKFINDIPHLFNDGQVILDWLGRFNDFRESLDGFTFAETDSLTRAIQVVRTMVYTANVTCLSDLWLLRQITEVYVRTGILDVLLSGEAVHPNLYGHQKGLDEHQLLIDFKFLHARGYLEKEDAFFKIPQQPQIHKTLKLLAEADMPGSVLSVKTLVAWLLGDREDLNQEIAEAFIVDPPSIDMHSWIAGPEQVELGYRLAPVLLALRVLDVSPQLKKGAVLSKYIPKKGGFEFLDRLFERAAWMNKGVVTELGARVFARGPGPVGIIYAYWPYMQNLFDRVRRQATYTSVSRAANVAASQDANRRSFMAANDALDRFCDQHGYQYSIFVEHAVGQGEASRQRYERSGPGIHYFGADLEDVAIEQAEKQQALGLLPNKMAFIRDADIGEPERVTTYLDDCGILDKPKVMVVGNGFHEIRNHTNEKMIDVFHKYREAGFVLIFTEESALTDEHLVNTAWNTYHAGFRYVHEMSGQGLRPIWDKGGDEERWGWRHCAEEGGYVILDEFCYRSRTIYPLPSPERENPSISMTYFCVPAELVEELGIDLHSDPPEESQLETKNEEVETEALPQELEALPEEPGSLPDTESEEGPDTEEEVNAQSEA